MSVIRTRRPSLRHLPAALAAAGLMTTVALAGPAAAWDDAHGPQSGYFQAVDHENVTAAFFQTYDGYDPGDLTLMITPVAEDGTPLEGAQEVEFTALDVIDGGAVDVLETRRALGAAGEGLVRYDVVADGQTLNMGITLQADADLADDQGAAVHSVDGPQMAHLEDRPLAWDSAMQLAPGLAGAEIVHLVAAPTMEGTYAKVVTEPAHGEVFVFRDSEHSQLRAWYIPEEGFVGTDTFTVDFHSDHVAHVQTVTVHVGAEIPAAYDGFLDAEDGVLNGKPLDLTDPDTAAALAAFRGDEAAPAPEDEEEQPAPVEDDADEQHTTPDTVETGQSTGWWLAGLGAAAAGVLVAARRRLGLTG
ncbi:hypothetical protein [Micrococcus luteus]|uniref:hypothetical protein n=1 Tax=Micrococcus luteus TaxID=1270 RepID=UPI001D0C46A5|nr:hypothetical protein [Micrococcus luteus]MCC0765620.1 hypothetical protein [Micrococcus luteus]